LSAVTARQARIRSLAGSGAVSLGGTSLSLTQANDNFGGVISGSGGLTLASGTQTLSGVNAYTGETTIASESTLALAGNGAIAESSRVAVDGRFDVSGTTSGASIRSLAGVGTVDLGKRTLTLTAAADSFQGTISGTGGLRVTGGTEVLTGTNTYTGGTTIQGGTLQLGNGGTTGSITGAVVNDGTLVFNRSNGMTLEGVISGSGSVEQMGTGTTILTGTNTYTGGTTISGGTLQIGNGGTTGTIAGDVMTDGVLSFYRSNDIAFAGEVSGTGGIVKRGAGKLTLSGDNSYSGGTYLQAGTLRVESDTALGTYDVAAEDATLEYAAGIEIGNTLIANSTALELNVASGTATQSGMIMETGTPAALTKSGAGTLIINEAYNSGQTKVLAGTLKGGADNAFSLFSAHVVSSGATLDLGGYDQVVDSLSGAGTVTNSGTSASVLQVGIAGVTSSSSEFSGTIADGTGGLGLYVQTSGTLTLSGNNTYTGDTVICDCSTLEIGNGGTTGAVAGDIVNNNILAFNRSNSYTFDHVISDGLGSAGQVEQNGTGTTIFTKTNTYTGGTTINAGTLQLGNGGMRGSILGDVEIELGGALAINRSNTYTFDGSIAGSGSFAQKGTGTTIFGDGMTYSGGTTISAGTLQIGTGYSDGSIGTGDIVNDGTLSIDKDNTLTIAGDISGTGAFNTTGGIDGTGTTTLTGSNTYSGTTKVLGGTLKAGSTGAFSDDSAFELSIGSLLDLNGRDQAIASLAGRGNVDLGAGSLTTGGSDGSTTFAGGMVGTGGLTKVGDGIFTLSGAGTYSGETLVDGGTLRAGSVNALSDSSAFTVSDGAALDLNGYSQTIGSIAGEGDITLGAGTLTAGRNNTSTAFSGDISGTGGFTKAGTGTLTLSGSNNYAGATTVSGGTLRAGGAGAFSDESAFTVDTGATLDLGSASQTIGSLAGAGTVALGARTLTFGGDDTSTLFEGSITGTGGIAKTGSGTFTLSGTSGYTGATLIDGGTLLVDTGSQLAGDSAFTVSSGAILDLGSSDQTIASLAGAGGVVLGSGTLTTGGNQSSTTFSGAISGTGGLEKTGTGTFTLSGNNTYTGDTVVDGGVLEVTGRLGNTDVTVNSGTTLSGFGTIAGDVSIEDGAHLAPGSGTGTMTLGSLVLADGAIFDYQLSGVSDRIDVTGDLTLDGTLNISDTRNFGAGLYRLFSYGGSLTDRGLDIGAIPSSFDIDDLTVQTDVTRQVNLINSHNAFLKFWDGGDSAKYNNGTVDGGSGTWTASGGTWTTSDGSINGRNRPQPGFAIFQGTAGTVTVDDARGAISVTGMQFATNGYRVQGDDIALVSADTVIRVGDGRQAGASSVATIASKLTGTGRLVKDDLGTLVLTAANSYTGGTLINAGTLSISADANLGSSTGGLTFDGGTLRNTSAFTTARSVSLLSRGGTFRTDANLTVSSVISGSGSLGKSGTGTLTLTNANTYTGGTVISAGTLQVGNGGTTGSIVGNVTNNGLLAFNRSDAITFGGNISGSGSVQKNGTGTLVLTGTNTYAGTTTINTGTLQIGNGGTTGSVAGNIVNKGALAINRSNALLLGGTISGTGSLKQVGMGTTVFAGNNTYTGGTTISAGTLQIGNGGTTGSIAGNITNNGILGFNRSNTLTFAGKIAGTGSVYQGGKGTTVLTANNTYTGGTTIKTGRLQIGNGGTTGSITGNVVDNGVLAFNRSNTVTFAGKISGRGVVEQGGKGNLILTANNTYTGGTTIKTGRLQIGNGDTTGSITGNIVDNGVLAFNRSNTLTVAGKISGSGSVQQIGKGTTVLTGTNTYTGGTTITAGTLKGSATSFGKGKILNNSALVIDQKTNATFANVINGKGTFTKTGSGTLLLTGNSSGFSGDTIVAAGRLSVNGSLKNSMISVLKGANLGGSGTIGGLTAGKGAVIAPGNSIGTLKVTGDFNVQAGSRLEIETNGNGDSDKIIVSGTARLAGGTVRLIAGTGNYSPTTTFDFLTATGGITGRFEAITSDMAFLIPDFTYGPNGITVDLDRNDVSFESVGKTRNQRAVANALDLLGTGNGVYDALIGLDKPNAQRAFDALSGEVHASVQGMLVNDSRFIREAANARIRAAFGDGLAATQPVTTYGEGGLTTVDATTDRLAIWGQAFGSWSSTDGEDGTATFKRSVGGFLGGADIAAFDNWRFGVIAGYGRSSFDALDRSSSGNSDDYHAGIYGGGRWGGFGLSAGASYSHHEIDTKRSAAFGALSEDLTADYNARTIQVFGEAGYQFRAGPATFEPFVGLAYVNLHTDSFKEKGGAAALNGLGSDTDVTFTTVGLRTSTDFTLDGIEATARGMVGWRHAFGDTTPLSSLSIGGSAFTAAGVPIAEDSAIVEAGFDLGLSPNAKLGVSYVGQFAKGLTEQGFKANLDVKF